MLSTEVHCWGCPFWCQNAQKEATWRGRHAKEAENLAFSGGKRWWNGLKLSQSNPDPLAHHFHWVSLPGLSGTMSYHAKPYCPGQRLLGSVRGWKKCKRVREGEDSKSKQNTSTTVGKSRPGMARNGQDLVCLLLLLRTIETAGSCLSSTTPEDDRNGRISSVFYYSWGRLKRPDLICLLGLLVI